MDTLGNVVEKIPVITAALWTMRPIVSLNALEAVVSDFIHELPESSNTMIQL